MSVELPEAIVQFLRTQPPGCWSIRSEGQTALLVKAPADTIHSQWRTPLALTSRPCQQQEAWGLALRLQFGELTFDVFWNLSHEAQKYDAESLASQDHINVYFFDEEMNYIYTRRLAHSSQEREKIKAILEETISGD
ncbi:MAG: hypothetical protein HY664_05120 [Chloroflexi bacterium]|nr:hypothetical protein [Chloroflexota bacterium]